MPTTTTTPRYPTTTAGESADHQEPTSDNNNDNTAALTRAATTARQQRRATISAVLNSHAWKAALIAFALILLFGAQVSELFLPPSTDIAVDAIFVMTLAFFTADILMRCESEDHYFSRIRCTGICCLSVGSFLFWCDLVSALTLLTDISWINKRSFSEQQIQIALGDFGIPVRPVLPGSVM